MTESRLELPLFPLHAVLFPGGAMPLHIFEERYRQMIERCIDGAEPFGIVLIEEGRDVGPLRGRLAEVGTTAVIREARRYPDGRFDLMAVGGRRFRILGVDPGREPYLLAQVTLLQDPLGDPAGARALAGRVSQRFLRYLEVLGPALEGADDGPEIEIEIEIETPDQPAGESSLGRAETVEAEPVELRGDPERRELLMAAARRLASPDDPTVLSYVLAGLLEVELPRRQELLAAADAERRLGQIDALLTRELTLLGRDLKPYTVDRRGDALRRN